MLPDNEPSSPSVRSAYIHPAERPKRAMLDWEWGGLAIQNPAGGFRYQIWRFDYDPVTGNVTTRPEGAPESDNVILITNPNITEIAGAFDQNMYWHVTYKLSTDNNVYLTTPNNGDIVVPDARSPRITMDDRRYSTESGAWNDIIFTYIRDNTLFYRQQRDLYGIEYVIGTSIDSALNIRNFGMTNQSRLQWRLT